MINDMDTGGYGAGAFEIWRLWVPPTLLFVLLVHLSKFNITDEIFG